MHYVSLIVRVSWAKLEFAIHADYPRYSGFAVDVEALYQLNSPVAQRARLQGQQRDILVAALAPCYRVIAGATILNRLPVIDTVTHHH
jgi:hypothetical protein